MKFLKYILAFVFIIVINKSFTQTTITISASPNPSCAGTGVTFNSQVNNCSNPQYQWYKNSVPISGATSSTYFSNSLNNGDIIFCQQTNTTPPCTAATSASRTITIYALPTITLISPSGSNNQTICQYESIDTIKYAVTGSNITMSISGLPTGLSTSFVSGVYKIFGSPTQIGTFNYTLTASTSSCGQTSQNGSINVKQKIIPSIIPGASSTTLSSFNGQDFIVRCNSTSQANVIIANGLSASDQSQINQYKIVWGDGSPDTIFNPFTTNIIHSYPNGSYQLTIYATHNSTGCIGSKTYGVFVGNSPSGTLGNPGNLSGCIPKTIKFPISNTLGNIPGTKYLIKFGDGDSIVYTHPIIPDTLSHDYIRTSCNNIPSTGANNTFAATMLVTNPCGSATSTVSGIEINEPPTANFFLIPNKICNDKSITVINNSTSGFVVTGSGCKNSAKKYWTITPSSGWNTTNNLGNNGGNPGDIDLWTNGDSILNINFTQPGLYYITIYLGNGCSGISTKLDSIRVFPNPPAPIVNSPVIYCQNAIADTLIATALSGNILKWYTVANGGVGSFSSPTPITTTVGNTTYYVSQVTPDGCEGPRIALVVTINPTPLAPTVTTPIDYCQNATASSLVATGNSGNTIKWYTVSTGGTSSSSAPTPITTTLGSFYFYATQTNSFNCESPRAEIEVNINPNPSAPTVTSPVNYCQNYTAIPLTATPNTGNTLLWYSAATGGTGSTTAPTPLTNTVGNTDYFVSQVTSKNCEGPRIAITVTINPTPVSPTVTSPITYCQGSTTTALTATASSGHTLLWYSSSTGGSGSTTAPTPSSSTTGTTSYYVSQINSFSCESPRAQIDVVINETPTVPSVISPVQLCQNQTTGALTASPNTNNTLLWYNIASGGIGSSTAPTPNTSTVGSTNYFVSQITPQNCEGPRAQITVTINPVPNINSTSFSNPTQCATPDGTITLNGLTASTTYTVSYTINGFPQSTSITTNSSGVIIMPNLLAGTYADIKVTLIGCTSNIVGPIVLTDPNPPATPTITAVNNICSGKNLSLNASTTTSGTATYNWVGPNGFSSSTQNPIIASITTAYTGTYNVTVTINNCTSLAGTKNITVDSTPQQPTVITNSPVCKDSTLFLSATTASSGTMTYNWSGPNSFTAAIQSPSITNVTNANAGVYSVTATSSANCISTPQTATVQINPTPFISNTTFTHPTLCATADGSISLYGLTASTTYAVTYTRNGSPLSATITANSSGVATLTNLLAGTYANIKVVLNGCSSNIVGPIVLADPNPPATPTINAVNNICSGNTLNLAASTTTSGTATYNWTGPNSFSSSTQNPSIASITTAYTGTYNVTVTINNCTSLAGTKNITVDSTPQQPTVITNSPVCNDSTLFLSATTASPGAMTYNWIGPNSFTAAIQNPSITNVTNANAGVYSVTATSSANCISTPQTATVQVNPTPVISNTTFNNPTLCANADGSISLYGLTASTTYAVTYTRNGSPQSATITANSSGVATLTNLLAGTYANIKVVLNGCSSNIVGPIVLADPNPPATPTINAVNNICSGNILNLAASTTTSGTATYNWTGPNGFSSSTQNPSIASITTAYTGTYNVTVTINNCTSLAGTKNITVDSTPQQPTIITNSPVCKDSTLFLSATTASPGTMTYNWIGPNSFTAAIQNPSITNVTNANAGIYSVTATSSANCISTPQTATVQVNPAPVINPRNDTTYNDNVNSGTINFTANLPGTQFSWTNNNTSIGLAASGNGSINFTTANPTANPISGLITVTPILNGCPGLPFSFTIRVNPSPKLSSPLTDSICTNILFTYQATSATNNIKFTWIRNVVAGISNAANNSTDSSGLIAETLINTTTAPVVVTYQFKLYYAGVVSNQIVLLTVYPKAKASFTYTKDSICAPAFIDSSIIKLIKFDSANISYEWYANNVLIGTTNYFPGYPINNANDSVIIKLKAISKYGCTNDSFQHKFYTYIKPLVSFTKNKQQGCGPLSVIFTNTSSPLNYPKYLWVFGNGDSSKAINPPTIIFKSDTSANRKDTVYYIKLFAFTTCDTLMFMDSVIVHPKPKALFQPNNTTGCSIFAFSAVNNSWGDGTTYWWDFGDNTFLYDSSKATVNHNYSTLVTDTFTVKLAANNICGTDTFAVNIVVFPNTIVPKLIIDGNNNYSCAPVNIKFVNNSTGANKFTINFGDGSLPLITFKTPDTIYHPYPTGGTFIVTMKAENNCTDSTISQTIQLYDKPVASFTTTTTQYCKKQPITFTNTSNTSLSYEWKFGDGSTSINYSPTYVYNTAGIYTVTLIVKSVNPSGAICTDTARKIITIYELPNSSFTDNAVVNNCQPFYYNANTIQPNGNISNWTFTDPFSVDTTQFGNNGTHIFTTPGTFNIKLIVFTPQGCSDTTNKTIRVVETPKANFSMSDSASCVPGKIVTLTNQFTYNSPDAINFEWYVDGNLVGTTRNLVYPFTTSINIATATIFTIKSVVTNSFGCRDSITKIFTVYPKAKPSFTISTNSICSPVILTINNTSQYSNIYKWYLDGQLISNSAIPNPIVLNQPLTTYSIKLVADNTLGCGADSTAQQYTTSSIPLADFNIPIKTSCTGILDIQGNNSSSVVGANIIKWFWNFGDGTTSTNTNTTHTYTTPGKYIVSLQVQDDRGCLSNIKKIEVTNFGKPKSYFTINNACIFNPVIPVNLSTPGFGSTNITSYLWNFGDGTFLTGLQPIHVYPSEGIYTINLITTSDSSCVADTFSQKITIYGKPIADFKFQNNCVSLNTFFSNQSLPGFGQTNIASSKWSFGDGGSGTNLNATHIYNTVGNYSVKLIVAGNYCPNLVDSITKIVPILQGRASVTYPRVDGVRGVPLQLNALSGGVGYLWNPNIGLNSDIIQNPIATYGLNAPNIINYNIEITDSIGCSVTDKQTVWLFAGSDVYLPTAFSPNGDGANDLFKPLFVNIYRLHYFRIFDRWGKLVFETSDMNKAWDGTMNGQPLPLDTYAWIIMGNGENGKEVIKKGNVTLIRN